MGRGRRRALRAGGIALCAVMAGGCGSGMAGPENAEGSQTPQGSQPAEQQDGQQGGQQDEGSEDRSHQPARRHARSQTAVEDFGEPTRTVTVPTVGVSFDAPAAWQEIDAGAMADPELVRQYAEQAGVDPTEFAAALAGVDLTLVENSDVAGSGPAANITVSGRPGALTPLPRAALEQQLGLAAGAVGGEVTRITQGEGAIGRYFTAQIVREFPGRTSYSINFTVDIGTGLVAFTITAPDAERSEALLGLVARTLAVG